GCLRPVEDRQGRIAEDPAQALFEVARRPVPAQLDHQAARRRMPLLFRELAGDEADGHDAVLLGRIQQPLAGALPGAVVLEDHLVEPGERVSRVRHIVNGQAPPAAGVDVGERPVREAGPLAGGKPGHAPTITDCLWACLWGESAANTKSILMS